ncbi:tumor necrosis factor receptor superfamily member 25 isoform X2 [Pristis pectinata]|uniref:tumor necrosis factor receptor superfamily member 25 isoform X2 n=1 Tax=Pristis pectinata TaxID=685728 RepID=UPI00223E1F1B|nr:tumor necrosis factor receptor superfamily member 25 isoform X2 [Pristis pectinata]
MWIRSLLCAMIFASGTLSHLTTDDSWSLTRAEGNTQILIWESKQLGIWKDKDQKRRKRNSEKCPNHQYRDSRTSFCCRMCPAGSYVESSCEKDGDLPQCKTCPSRTYLAFDNYRSECQSCTICDKQLQTTIHNCTATNNTVCGCKAHQYRQCHLNGCKFFHCLNCSMCSNRKVIKPCSQQEDAQCGECLPGFYQHGDQCQNCTEIKNDSSPNTSGCFISKPSYATVLKSILSVLGSLFILFVMIQLLRCKFQRTWVVEEPKTLTVTVPEDEEARNEVKALPFEIPAPEGKSSPLIDFPVRPLANNNIYGTSRQISQLHSEEQVSMPLDGRTLYEIINLVPVRRWKELMRLLKLKECDIERIEMDVTHSRDQQYEMLRQWSQQQTASMESLYQALEIMNLTGLAEELKTKLLNYSNSPC